MVIRTICGSRSRSVGLDLVGAAVRGESDISEAKRRMANKPPPDDQKKKVQLKAPVPKRAGTSIRANLIPVRPTGESQKTLKKDAERKMTEMDTDERRRSALLQFMQREMTRMIDPQQRAEEMPTEEPAETDYFNPGAVIADRFKVMRKLHGGAFGQVYSAQDQSLEGGWAAIKIESLRCPTPLLSLETTVLRSVQDRAHSPMYVSAGRIGNDFNYLAMQLVGPNLDSLRRRCPFAVKRFSIGTAMRLTLQCLEAIRDLHVIGWIHRDIKASNFAIGGSRDNMHTVFLLDYGLCREHLVKGKVRAERKVAGFRGTVRYASMATHCMKDLGRKDDLWSLYYTIAEWVNGGLAWSNEVDQEIVFQLKQTTPFERLAPSVAELMIIVGNYLEGLSYTDEPDYKMIENTLHQVCEAKGIVNVGIVSDPFDWENNFESLRRE